MFAGQFEVFFVFWLDKTAGLVDFFLSYSTKPRLPEALKSVTQSQYLQNIIMLLRIQEYMLMHVLIFFLKNGHFNCLKGHTSSVVSRTAKKSAEISVFLFCFLKTYFQCFISFSFLFNSLPLLIELREKAWSVLPVLWHRGCEIRLMVSNPALVGQHVT